MIRDLLPIGSVVQLQNEEKPLMIIGILQRLENTEEIYEYTGVPYPEGYMGEEYQFVFNHKDINIVLFTGYESSERDYFINNLLKAYEPENAITDLPVAPLEEEINADINAENNDIFS